MTTNNTTSTVQYAEYASKAYYGGYGVGFWGIGGSWGAGYDLINNQKIQSDYCKNLQVSNQYTKYVANACATSYYYHRPGTFSEWKSNLSKSSLPTANNWWSTWGWGAWGTTCTIQGTNLKPNTKYKLYLGDKDVTERAFVPKNFQEDLGYLSNTSTTYTTTNYWGGAYWGWGYYNTALATSNAAYRDAATKRWNEWRNTLIKNLGELYTDRSGRITMSVYVGDLVDTNGYQTTTNQYTKLEYIQTKQPLNDLFKNISGKNVWRFTPYYKEIVIPVPDPVPTPNVPDPNDEGDTGNTTPMPPEQGEQPKPNPFDPGGYVWGDNEYDYIQTFYVDPDAVNKSPTVALTGVDLFARELPPTIRITDGPLLSTEVVNKSGYEDPGILIEIIDIENGKPIVDRAHESSRVLVTQSQMTSSGDATIPIRFTFANPVIVPTGKSYGIAINLEDEDFGLWYSKRGNRLVGTNNPSEGSSARHDGDFFIATNSTEEMLEYSTKQAYKALSDIDLKFNVHVAKYTSNTLSVNVVPQRYEFITIDQLTGSFYPNEIVYKKQVDANDEAIYLTGTITTNITSVTITGSGTLFDSAFSEGDYVLITDESVDNTDIVVIEQVVSNTELVVEEPPKFAASGVFMMKTNVAQIEDYNDYFKSVILNKSTANATHYLANNDQIIGLQSGATANITGIYAYPIHSVTTDMEVGVSDRTKANLVYNFSYYDGSDYRVNTELEKTASQGVNHITNYPATLMSRSLEVLNPTHLFGGNNRSAMFRMDFNYQGSNVELYQSPGIVVGGAIDMIGHRFYINNDNTNEDTVTGNAISKHLSTIVTLGPEKFAEDIRVYMSAFKPEGTDIKVYAKVYNSEDEDTFDEKSWTELTLIDGTGQYSSINNRTDTRQFTYGFPQFPASNTTLDGTVTTELSNNILVGEGTTWDADLANNQVIKIYSSLFPNNYQIAVVNTVSSNTSLDLKNPISNNNIVGDGFKIDTLQVETSAFNNQLNDNVARYYSTSKTEYDGYNVYAIKTVLLSNTSYIVPYVDDIRTVAVSA